MKKVLLFAVVVFGLAYFLFQGHRRNEEPAKPAPAATTAAPAAIPQAKATEGAAFNSMFPRSGDGFIVTFTQEKDGFAQADLSKGSGKVAQLSISDTDANPSARDKFKSSTKLIGGFPSATLGQGTSVLVANRYQVQVRSLNSSFTATDREAWIEKFKLSDLAHATFSGRKHEH